MSEKNKKLLDKAITAEIFKRLYRARTAIAAQHSCLINIRVLKFLSHLINDN